jgi:hypothetical protein
MSIAALTDWWSQHLHVTFQTNGFKRSALITLPGTRTTLTVGALQAPGNPGDAPHTVYCTVRGKPLTVNKALLRVVVDKCLTPALRGTERDELPAWLYSQKLTQRTTVRDFPRYRVEVDNVHDVKTGGKLILSLSTVS